MKEPTMKESRPEAIKKIIKDADNGADNISNEDWIELKNYIEGLESQIDQEFGC